MAKLKVLRVFMLFSPLDLKYAIKMDGG